MNAPRSKPNLVKRFALVGLLIGIAGTVILWCLAGIFYNPKGHGMDPWTSAMWMLMVPTIHLLKMIGQESLVYHGFASVLLAFCVNGMLVGILGAFIGWLLKEFLPPK